MGPRELSAIENRPAFKNAAQARNYALVHWERALWVDGVLTQEQLGKIFALKDFVRLDQRNTWALVYFSSDVSWSTLIDILHPAPFVLQKDREAKTLNINFNLSEAQMERLREFLTVLRPKIVSTNNCK